MAVTRCRLCPERTPVEWLDTVHKKRLPFEHQMVDKADLNGRAGWLISRRAGRAVATPIEHCGAAFSANAKRVLVVHQCAGYANSA